MRQSPRVPRAPAPPGETPPPAAALYRQALQLQRSGQLAAAAAIYERILRLDSNQPDALHFLGIIAAQTNQHKLAVDLIERSIALSPAHAPAYNSRGNALKGLGRLDEALGSFDRAIALEPGYAEAFYNRGNVLRELQRPQEAIASYDRAIALRPDYAKACVNRGISLGELHRPDEALASYDRAIALQPDYAEAHNNRGNALKSLARPDEAVASFDRAIALRPDYAEAHVNRGSALADCSRIEEALASYERAIALQPDLADAHWNKALALLLAGELASGWPLYEWRWKRKGAPRQRDPVAPTWSGEARSQSLLILPEQGIGDEIFYAGMLPDVSERAERITLVADPRLVPLFERSFAGHRVSVVGKSAELPPHAQQIQIGSLGRIFRSGPASSLRVRSPYLHACPVRRADLRRGLGGNGELVCGLSWSSRNAEFGAHKTLSLRSFAPLLSLPRTQWVNLQYGDTEAEQDALREGTGLALTNVGAVDNTNDLDGLAALIDACDVVVTISNTTAHLAGALGKPVLILLPDGAGLRWYWHLERRDSPWYPSARLFRQDDPSDWERVVEAVRRELVTRTWPVDGAAPS